MAAFATAAAWLIAAPLLTISATFATEVLFGLAGGKRRVLRTGTEPQNVVLLIPAHDEERGISTTLARLRNTVPASWHILVVADNCTDGTAQVVREAGFEAIERFDPAKRGKGHALAFGRDHLRRNPPEVVIILDADCRIEEPTRLAATAFVTNAPVQAKYLLEADHTLPPMVQISAFAFALKNLIRQRGLVRLGAPAVLMGTGMAFTWSILRTVPLATSHLTEDLQLGVQFAQAGIYPLFEPDTVVVSESSSVAGTMSQRMRWEAGFLATAGQYALPLLRRGLLGANREALLLGLHLAVPPLTLLFLFGGLGLLATAAATLIGGSPMPALSLAFALFAVTLAVLGAWRKIGRPYLSGATLCRLPLYLLWKIPMYLKMLVKRNKAWVRTERLP